MKSFVIAGGGIAGILSALLLSQMNNKVTLIEKQPTLGGLLNSYVTPDGLSFDYGTHILAETGVEELDTLLFEEVREETQKWSKLDKLEVGVYFNGKLDEEGPCIDARYLDKSVYSQGVVDLLNSVSTSHHLKDTRNLDNQLVADYGETFANHIFLPIVNKLFGEDPDKLQSNALELFVSPRIKVLNSEITKTLKKIPQFDRSIAYHENESKRINYYPSESGIGAWIEQLKSKLIDQGVKIILGQTIESVDSSGNIIERVKLSSGEEIILDYLIWSLPPSMLLSVVGQPMASHKPQIRKVKLFHYQFDRPLISKSMYITNFDPKFKSFRITNYSNINHNQPGNRCTVELLYSQSTEVDYEEIFCELVSMGVISPETQIISTYSNNVSAGFPILSNMYENQLRNQLKQINENFSNVLVIGKTSGKGFFMNDVLIDTYNTIKDLRCLK